MKLRNTALVFTASLCLWFATASQAGLTQTGDPCFPQQIFTAASAMHSLILVSSAPVVLDDETLGHVLAYDDPTTERLEDYFELYNSDDNLLAIGWYDRFGIRRIAVDEGLFDDAHQPQGVFVTLLDGDSV